MANSPKAIEEIEGNRSKEEKARRQLEFDKIKELPKDRLAVPDKSLTVNGKKKWLEVVELLSYANYHSNADYDNILLYCKAYEEWIRLNKMLKKCTDIKELKDLKSMIKAEERTMNSNKKILYLDMAERMRSANQKAMDSSNQGQLASDSEVKDYGATNTKIISFPIGFELCE